MKLLFSILITIISAFMYAQDSIQVDTSSLNKHQLGITYSTDYTFRYLEAEPTATWLKNIADSMEAPTYGFSTGIQYGYKLGKKTSLSTGVLFTDNGEKTKNTVNFEAVNYKNHYYFLSIPLRLDYTLISKKAEIYSIIGLSGNFFINHKTRMDVENKKEAIQFNNRSSLATFNLGGIAGIGMQAKLADNWNFKLEVTYKQSITPVNNDPVRKWLYAIGPNFGLFYSFHSKQIIKS
jgi:opacity protein-like surface antigen